jgi:hypothetical protein
MFRASAANKILWVEFWSLYDTPQGLVGQVRFFKSDPEPLSPPAETFRVRIAAPNKLIFENISGGSPKSLTMTHFGANNFLSRVEAVGADGESTFIGTDMRRVQ